MQRSFPVTSFKYSQKETKMTIKCVHINDICVASRALCPSQTDQEIRALIPISWRKAGPKDPMLSLQCLVDVVSLGDAI